MSRFGNLNKGSLALLFVSILGVGAVATKSQWDWMLDKDVAVTTDVTAPVVELEEIDQETERLYRISPDNGSALTYSVEESLAGSDRTAVGVTHTLAGDIVVDLVDPSNSRIGAIVINVEMFDSDSSLRDKRIRHDFLESRHFPFASFVATEIVGLPTTADDNTETELTITGDLTVKETSLPITFTGTASMDADTLTATMTSQALMSDYDIGPIHVAGLAHTGNEIGLTFVLVADRVGEDSPTPDQIELAVRPVVADAPDAPFSETVQPIIQNSCASCHVEGGAGWSTLQLDTVGQAAEIAADIQLVTAARYMPPWPASDLSLDFEHDFSLGNEEIATISAWAEAGGGLDVDPDTPIIPTAVPYEDIERDQVTLPDEPYVGSLDQQDDYRCLIHEINTGDDGVWITGVAFEPDKDEVVHHSILFRVPAAGRAEANALSARDEQPGWECFGLSGMETEGVGSVGGWAPGQQPRVYPEGTGLFLNPGDFLVNQIHYHFDHETPPDRSTIVLETLSVDELAARETPMRGVQGGTYLTPAEGPCTPEESGPMCDRRAVIAEFDEKYGGVAPFIPNFLIDACGGNIEDFNQLDGTKFSSSCDQAAQSTGTIYSILGHMHEFGDSYRMTLHPDTPEEIILLDIPSWSFEWQLYYVPTEEIHIERGDIIRFECGWDRTNLYMPEPRYITWNEGTVDEMCFSTVSTIPDA
ncbi:MAG: YceI family protein [Acidimicrobiales bacterium]